MSRRLHAARVGTLTAAISLLRPRPWQRLERRLLGHAPTAQRSLIARRASLVGLMLALKRVSAGR